MPARACHLPDYERTIGQFHDFRWQALKVGEAAVSSFEVVNCDLDSGAVQGGKLAGCPTGILHDGTFRNFEL